MINIILLYVGTLYYKLSMVGYDFRNWNVIQLRGRYVLYEVTVP